MAKTKTGLLLPILLIAGGYFAVQNGVLDNIGGGGVEIIGTGDEQIMVTGSTKSKMKNCTPGQIVSNRQCDDETFLLINARKMPFIARNTKLAWESGSPATLTMNRPKQTTNRAKACPRSFPKPHGGQCDEYPMASTDEGGAQARAEEVPGRENQCQGPTYGAQYPKDGKKFHVVIVFPDSIAPGPFTGADIAKEQGWC